MTVSNFDYIGNSVTASAYISLLDWKYPPKVSSSQAKVQESSPLAKSATPTQEEIRELRLQKLGVPNPSSSSSTRSPSYTSAQAANSRSNIVTITEVLSKEASRQITALPATATAPQDPGQPKALPPVTPPTLMPNRDVALVGKTVVCVFGFAALSIVGLVETVARTCLTLAVFSLWMLNSENEKMHAIFERSMQSLLCSVGASFSSLIAILPPSGTCEQIVTRMVADGVLGYMRPWSPVRI